MAVPGVMGEGLSLDKTKWQVKQRDDSDFHFKICEPRIDPENDFNEDLTYNLRKISRLVAVDECRIEIEDNTCIAKVTAP